MKLYPVSWTVMEVAPSKDQKPDLEKPSQDDTRLLARIREITKPEYYEDLIRSIQKDEAQAGRYWTNDYLFDLIEKVRAEFEAGKVD
jgi:hypothetical protein